MSSTSTSHDKASLPTTIPPVPSLVLLYVQDPARSAAFYEGLLGRPPVEASGTFAMFVLQNGLKLGLWSRHTVEPAASAAGGGGELAFAVGSEGEVRSVHTAWTANGVDIVQAPVEMDFGFTFVALDPDGHRLRVYCPGAA